VAGTPPPPLGRREKLACTLHRAQCTLHRAQSAVHTAMFLAAVPGPSAGCATQSGAVRGGGGSGVRGRVGGSSGDIITWEAWVIIEGLKFSKLLKMAQNSQNGTK
jgi:hypothetical protein